MYYVVTDVERIEYLEQKVDEWRYLENLNAAMWDGERFNANKREFFARLQRPFFTPIPQQTSAEARAEAEALLAYVNSKKGGWKTEVNGREVDVPDPV